MQKFITHTGIAAPIMRNNINTDAIIPSKEMRTVSKTGLSNGLFAPWRYLNAEAREADPDFVFNKTEYQGCSIILSGSNFGCGSSREHAVWALKEFGIRSIVAEGFGSIFFNNCVRNGILPIKLARQEIDDIVTWVEADPQENQLVIDLSDTRIDANGDSAYFKLDGSDQEMLLNGLDPIAVTQKLQTSIDAFQTEDKRNRAWL